MSLTSYPGGSRSRVNRAGDNVRAGVATADDLRVIEDWRAAHRAVLNTFQAILHNRARGTSIVVAQRHKRKVTVFDKLTRQPKMSLSRMDDVAGCRLIFENKEELYKFRDSLHKARFKHRRRNDVDKYDYIKAPKDSGYRGIHDIYEYDVNSDSGRHLAGLYVEVQYRTIYQHAWSTANEILGSVTASEPKFQRGDEKILHAMLLASEILSRAYENVKGAVPSLSDRELVQEFIKFDDETGLLSTLRRLNPSEAQNPDDVHNYILVFKPNQQLNVFPFNNVPQALRQLFELENEHPDWDIVLVRGESKADVRIAFTNYFSDAREFLSLIDNGCEFLTGAKTIDELQQKFAARQAQSQKTAMRGPVDRKKWWNR